MQDWISVALPKGRLGEKAYDLFERIGYGCPSIREDNRKLIFENEEARVRYFWAKPSDVSIYVERGAADVGVAGKDILLEYAPDVYELNDLKMGRCRMMVAGQPGALEETGRTLRVATKFPRIAAKHFAAQSREIEIIKLNGSIEIAPLLGLSDVIVDIVETGTTLKENGLIPLEEVVPISARFIANRVSYKFKNERMREMQERIGALIAEKQ
ncbi:MAG: ATP phosphoribosyltransferase [Clostridia bacterium]|nr:ATP phosphoribosyltransferase [Clostridia bacterium]MBQ6691981.1 ATP phosphoribosyltransferase [Clostridia bacterium]MBQ7112649.1 ATP phosphoribosyltransferase [Clostridia bacterium]